MTGATISGGALAGETRTPCPHSPEQSRAGGQPIGHQGVEMRVEVHVLAESADRHHDAGQAVGQVQRDAHEFKQALVGDPA